MIKTLKLVSVILAWCITFSLSAQCPNSLSGHTLLGEYNDSKYFISNTASTWSTAQSNASANGGYLASITSQGENDFILSNLNAIVFIGYNDVQNEGNFTWDSGESVGFNKFADINTASRDYGKMNYWNGNWGLDNQNVSRKSIVEIPCSSSGGGITITSCPSSMTGTAPHGGNYTTPFSWNTPTATTDCPQGGLTITQTQGGSSGSNFGPISNGHTIVYEIEDACGNTENCVFFIDVAPASDIINCPSDITVTATSAAGAIVTYADVMATTFCSQGPVQINSGLPSGSLFPIGTTSITMTSFLSGSAAWCQNTAACNFTVTVNPEGGGGDCDDVIAGFTTLGEYGGSKYFISNNDVLPAAAQTEAESKGGYLAVISSADENDFIQQNTNIMAYIGLNDVASEGNLEWVNGEPLTYNNVNPCAFCESNSESKDYVIMQPWDGGWSFSSQFNSRRYIMEVPCGDTGGDECSFDETIPLGFTGFGSTLSELKETSTGYQLASGDQSSGVERKVLEIEIDKSDGSVISSGNVIANTVVNSGSYWDRDANVLYDATLQNATAPNSVIVFRKRDASNNTIWSKNLDLGIDIYNIADIRLFDNEIILTSNSGPTGSLQVIKTNLNGDLIWASNLDLGVATGTSGNVYGESVNGGYYINYFNGGPFVVKVDNDGAFEWSINVGTSDPPSEKRFILGESADGSHFYMANSSFNTFTGSFARFNTSDGSFVGGGSLGEGLPLGTTIERSFFTRGVPTNDGGVVVFYSYSSEAFGPTEPYHDRFDASGNLVWRRQTPANISNGTFTILIAAADGGFILAGEINDEFRIVRMTSDGNFSPDCGGGNGNQPDLTLSNLDNLPSSAAVDEIVNFEFDLQNIGNATAVSSYVIGAYISDDATLSGDDILAGEIVTANTVVGTDPNVSAAILVPDVPDGEYYLIVKADINNNILESNENNNTIAKVITIGSGGGGCDNPPSISGFTYKASQGSKFYYLSNGTDRPTDAEAKCVSAGGHLATVTSEALINILQPHTNGLVYIGLHDENTEGNLAWRSGAPYAFNRFDNCSICEPNSDSKDYVVMQGWNGKWSWSGFYNTRKYWLEVDCNNLNSNNSTLIAFSTEEEEPLDFQKIVPNPATNHIFVQVKSGTAKVIDVEIYDARGVLYKSQLAEMFDGINAVEVDISDLPGGIYIVKIPQMNNIKSTKRFVKVGE